MKFLFVDRIGAHAIWGVILPIAIQLIERGHTVYFVRMDDGGERGGEVVPNDIKAIDIPVPLKRGILSLLKQQWIYGHQFRKLIRQIKPDIVHTNFASPSIVSRWVAAQEKVPVIVSTQHELYESMSLHYRLGLRLTERVCSAVVYVSHTVAASFGHNVTSSAHTDMTEGLPHIVIPNGVNLDKIHAAIENVTEKDPGVILCAGRMVPLKGQKLLIEAFAELLHSNPNVRLRLVGSGPMEEELHHLVKELSIGEYVDFMGWVPHDTVLREMAKAELVVVASSQEGFGLVVAEALACGTNLLVSDIPVFREVLNGFTQYGHFFRRGDVDELTAAMSSYFCSDGSKIGAGACELERLSSKLMVSKYLKLYDVLSDSRAKHPALFV